MLQIKGLNKRFDETVALSNVALSIPEGEFVGVIGRSGAGKSTLLRSINGLSSVDEGEICWQGQRVSGLRGRQQRVWHQNCAMIFQQFNLVPRLDVLTNVLMGRLSYHNTLRTLVKWFGRIERARAVLTLERVEMAERALQRVETLSGGQQQRVAIARALVQEPAILLADEPIASLDPRSAQRVMDILQAINREDGITVICNLHTLDTARQYCDRIVGMLAGRVVYDGAPTGLDTSTVRDIYGAEDDHEWEESVTSTQVRDSVSLSRRPRAA